MTKELFNEKVIALLGILHSVSYSMLPNPEDQADAVQECIKKALIKRESLRDDQFFKTWLIRILLNECHNIHRQKKREVPTEEIPTVAPPSADRDLFYAMQQLDERFRLPIVLHHIEGYAAKEVSQILRVPEGTIKARLVRGRRYLQDILNQEA